jgi:hypothetical protein
LQCQQVILLGGGKFLAVQFKNRLPYPNGFADVSDEKPLDPSRNPRRDHVHEVLVFFQRSRKGDFLAKWSQPHGVRLDVRQLDLLLAQLQLARLLVRVNFHPHQVHFADWASTRLFLHHLRVHRAGVIDVVWQGFGGSFLARIHQPDEDAKHYYFNSFH